MKILIVANSNPGHLAPFVIEQMEALKSTGVIIDTYGIVGKGYWGYLRNRRGLKKKIREFMPDLIQAYYGLSGLCANLQREVPVVTTYLGSDIHSGGLILKLSRLTMFLSKYNIFLTKNLYDISGYKGKKKCILPLGVPLDAIQNIPRILAKNKLGKHDGFVLFAGSFDNIIKNADLAKEAMQKIAGVELVELKGYSRDEVFMLMNAADCLLITSHREGSPQVIKEAMACGTPIVSVDVGNVKEVISGTEGCYFAERNPDDIAAKIKMALDFKGKTNGRQRIIDLGLSNDRVAKKLIEVYHKVLATSR